MKKNYLYLFLVGLILTGCSVDNDDIYQANALETANATVCDITAGADHSVELTNEYVKSNLYGVTLLRNYFLSLLDEGVSKEGTFSPSIYDLAMSYKSNNFQTFTTVYTVGDVGCSDSTTLSIKVVAELSEPTCTAGGDHEETVTNSYVKENLYGNTLLKNYYLDMLDEGVSREGTFSPSISSLIDSYRVNNYQSFETVYTIAEESCTDSTTLTLTVIPDPSDPVCSAGEDKSVTLTNSYVRSNLYGTTLLRNYYLNLLDEGVSKEGTFNPSIYTLVKAYKANNYQTFTTTYSISEDGCTDEVQLSIEVIP